MKVLYLVWLIAVFLCGTVFGAAPIRLAVIPTDSALAAPTDVLTVEFTQAGVELLERTQVDKVLREQALAATGADAVKLGQILGADGVLILELIRQNSNTVANARLAAVKPGVVLRQRSYAWPIDNVSDWSRIVSAQFRPLLPKLGVLPKDALPISILNLRAASRSSEAEAMERELTLLVQSRLTQEREIFVLERRRLGTLAEEKEFKSETNSPFWNGSYLLEGTLDRAGYSANEATVNARLVPPDGGLPSAIDVAGPRTNLVALAERISRQVLDAVRRVSSVPEWKPHEEAGRYYEEAKWALRWRMFKEAQAAAESAWALGKRDMDCALVRIKAYLGEVPPDTGGYQRGEIHGEVNKPERLEASIQELERHPSGLIAYRRHGSIVRYLQVGKRPEPRSVDRASHALALYESYSKTLSADEPVADSEWYRLGIESLEAATLVLQHFYLVPKAQPPVQEALAELRSLARNVSSWLARSSSARATYYWIADRRATSDDLRRITEFPNIFRARIQWGMFWEERPEDTIALYQSLAESPVFSCLSRHFGAAEVESPRLVAWRLADRQRVPILWKGFAGGLIGSSNLFQEIEGRRLQLAEAPTSKDAGNLVVELLERIFTNQSVLTTNTVALMSYPCWPVQSWINGLAQNAGTTPKEVAARLRQEYLAQLETLQKKHEAHWKALEKNRIAAKEFAEQRRFLLEQAPFDYVRFGRTFRFRDYSRDQAAELQPLFTAYRSNLIAQSEVESGNGRSPRQSALSRINMAEMQLQRVLTNASTTNRSYRSTPAPQSANVPARPSPVASSPVVTVSQFFKLPMARLATNVSEFFIYAHRWRAGKLWLDLRYQSVNPRVGIQFRAAAAALDPESGRWEIFPYPGYDSPKSKAPVGFQGEAETKLHFEIFQDCLYLSEWDSLKRCELRSGRWETLQFPGQQLAQLHLANGRLYAANEESIYEILDDGRSTRLLASARRRPVISALDSLNTFGPVIIFSGPNDTIRAGIRSGIYQWDGQEWSGLPLETGIGRIEIFESDALVRFTANDGMPRLWWASNSKPDFELCWIGMKSPHSPGLSSRLALRPARPVESPTWNCSNEVSFAHAPVTPLGSSLCFYVDDSDVTNTSKGLAVAEKDGRHGNLLWLRRGQSNPTVVPVRFDPTFGSLTSFQVQMRTGKTTSAAKTWLVETPTSLLLGQVGTPGIWSLPLSALRTAAGQASHRGLSP